MCQAQSFKKLSNSVFLAKKSAIKHLKSNIKSHTRGKMGHLL